MTDLISDHVAKDPSIISAKKAILKAIAQQQSKIVGIRPPDPTLVQSYEETIKEFTKIRGIDLWHPYLGSGVGKGALVELADGSIKYDFISGIGVHFGHGHPAIISALLDAAIQNTVMQGNLEQNIDSLELSKLLCKISHLPHCFLSTSGAMACENALKIILQKKAPASRILAFQHCFMGRTLALAQITDRPDFREKLPQLYLSIISPFMIGKIQKEVQKRLWKRSKIILLVTLRNMPFSVWSLCKEREGAIRGQENFFFP